MTYKKPIKYFQGTTLMDEPLSAGDNGIKREGSYAIEAFEAHKIVKAYTADPETGNDIKTLIPFHAIKLAEYVTITENAEKTDPYCGGGY